MVIRKWERGKIKISKSFIEQKIEMESKLVRDESMSILKEFEESEDLSRLEGYSSDDSKSSDE
jgi:hypothetical protein